MTSTYICTACSRLLSRQSSRSDLVSIAARKSPTFNGLRKFSTTPTAIYHFSHSLLTDSKSNIVKGSRPAAKASGVIGFAQKLRVKAPFVIETYVAYGATRELVKECVKPGDYTIPQALEKGVELPTDENGTHIGVGNGWWYDALGLTPTFSNWVQITFIYMYMLQVRFRMLPRTHAPVWIEHLTNHAFFAAEDRLVVWHKYTANSLRQKNLKDMFSQWRAVLLAYDEGLVKGDAMLAAAIWRNLLSAREDVDFAKLAQVVGYMRKELKRLDDASDAEIADGQWKFKGHPGDEEGLVKLPSALMSFEQSKS